LVHFDKISGFKLIRCFKRVIKLTIITLGKIEDQIPLVDLLLYFAVVIGEFTD